jgi:hypothetical protein
LTSCQKAGQRTVPIIEETLSKSFERGIPSVIVFVVHEFVYGLNLFILIAARKKI